MEKLDSRLAAAAEFVGYGTVAADIGTDHGYLVCWLVENGVCPKAYATDINEKPLESAKALIAEMGLGDKIETRLTNGLAGLPGEEIDEVLICGMGGETIMGILASHDWVKSERVHLVLQPMSRVDALRRWLYEKGWRIDEEKAVETEGHLYTVMSVEYTGDCAAPDEIFCAIGKVPECGGAVAVKYMRRQAAIHKSVAAGLMRSPNGKSAAMRHTILADMIEEQADETEKENEHGK